MRFTPQVRQWLYTAAAVATAVMPLLVAYRFVDTELSGVWLNVIAALGALGTGGAATAAAVTARQRRDGTLDFTGPAPQQAVEALKATVARAGDAQGDLRAVLQAVTEIVPRVASPSSGDPASADYQP